MIVSHPSGATSASLACQSVSGAEDAATRCRAIGPVSVIGVLEHAGAEGEPVRALEPLVGGTYGEPATVPYWLNAMLKTGGRVRDVATPSLRATVVGGGEQSRPEDEALTARRPSPAASGRRSRSAGSLPAGSTHGGRCGRRAPRQVLAHELEDLSAVGSWLAERVGQRRERGAAALVGARVHEHPGLDAVAPGQHPEQLRRAALGEAVAPPPDERAPAPRSGRAT